MERDDKTTGLFKRIRQWSAYMCSYGTIGMLDSAGYCVWNEQLPPHLDNDLSHIHPPLSEQVLTYDSIQLPGIFNFSEYSFNAHPRGVRLHAL